MSDYEGSKPVFLTGNELKLIRQIRDMIGIFLIMQVVSILVLLNAVVD